MMREINLLLTGTNLDNLFCESVIVPTELRDLGLTDIMLADLLITIAEDISNGETETKEEH